MRTEEPTPLRTQHPAQQTSQEALGCGMPMVAVDDKCRKSELVNIELMGGQTILVGNLLSSPQCEHVA